jgi:hypothetical protein
LTKELMRLGSYMRVNESKAIEQMKNANS